MANTQNEIAKRCNEISNEVTNEPWYEETVNNIIAIQKEICGCGNRIKPLLNRYDEQCLRIHSAIEEKIYITAFNEGLKSKP